MSVQGVEILTNCKFYFEAEGLENKLILEISGLSAESPSAGGDQVLGSGREGRNLRQAAPTQVKFTEVTLKIAATNNKDIYKWYADCNKNTGGQSDWKSNRKASSVTIYDQAGSQQARWELVNSYPTKYEGPQLEANSNDVANETITLVHEGFERVQ